MSRLFRWTVSIEDVDYLEVQPIEDALNEDGHNFDGLGHDRKRRSVYAEGEWSIGNGKDEQQEEREICSCIWKTVRRYVPVRVTALYLEDPDVYAGTKEQCDKVLAYAVEED